MPMYRIEANGKRRAICRECGKLHERRDCASRKRRLRQDEAKWEWVRSYQAELRRIDSGEVNPQCMECGGKGNRPNYASAVASGKKYLCYECVCGRKAAV